MTRLIGELRVAVRRLGRTPMFTGLAIITLIVGIGINTGMFSLMDALLLRPPAHVADPDRVFRLRFRVQDGSDVSYVDRADYASFAAIRDARIFASIAAFQPGRVSVDIGADASVSNAMLVSHDFMAVLGIRPAIGTLAFNDPTGGDGGDRVVISYGLWQT